LYLVAALVGYSFRYRRHWGTGDDLKGLRLDMEGVLSYPPLWVGVLGLCRHDIEAHHVVDQGLYNEVSIEILKS